MPFAQLVIGPPGSGKSTYCDGMHQFMSAIGRKCSVVNLDPANDHVSYPVAIDARELVPLEEVMEAEELGPNGGVLYGLEELEHNLDWLKGRLKELADDCVLFDCPGQVELFTHHPSLRNIFLSLQKLGYRLVVVHLLDSFVITRPSLYLSGLLLALRSMLQMELPHVNVLTKIDNLQNFGPLPFNLDFYTEAQGLEYLLPHLDTERPYLVPDPVGKSKTDDEAMEDLPVSKFHGLNTALVELIADFGLVGFETLVVEDRTSIAMLLRAIDRAGGYAFGGDEGVNDTVWELAVREGATAMDVRDVQERWIDRRDELDEAERRAWEEEGKAARDADRGTSHHGRRQSTNRTDGQNLDTQHDINQVMDLNSIRDKPMRDNGIKIIRKNS